MADSRTPETRRPSTALQQAPHEPQHTDSTETDPDQPPHAQERDAYIHQVVDSAPAPTPALLERLAQLLPHPDHPTPPERPPRA
ncbi:MAG: hypothetical protein ACRDRA_04525 [Pseudonocardiaceae bacterium]